MLTLIETGAVFASAVYGVLLGLRKGFDLVGLASVGFAVAFGGGTLRDLLIDRRPLFWVANEHYIWLVGAVAIAGALLPQTAPRFERYLALPDALGLGLFSVAGAGYAHEAGMSPLVSALMGVVTGAFGGVIADVICNETPSLFRPSPLYATCALAGALAYLGLMQLGAADWVSPSVGVATGAALRLFALKHDIHLPSRAGPAE